MKKAIQLTASVHIMMLSFVVFQVTRGYTYYKGYRAGFREARRQFEGTHIHCFAEVEHTNEENPPEEQAAHPVWGVHSRPRSV